MGAVPGPMDRFLTLRGAKTLAVRMERALRQRGRSPSWLTESPAVSEVFYPGSSAPGPRVAKRQMRVPAA